MIDCEMFKEKLGDRLDMTMRPLRVPPSLYEEARWVVSDKKIKDICRYNLYKLGKAIKKLF